MVRSVVLYIHRSQEFKAYHMHLTSLPSKESFKSSQKLPISFNPQKNRIRLNLVILLGQHGLYLSPTLEHLSFEQSRMFVHISPPAAAAKTCRLLFHHTL